MTQRDQKTLLILIVGLVGLGFVFVFVQSWFLGPFADYNRQLAALDDELESKENQRKAIVRGQVLVKQKQALSLPASQVKASEAYDRYLVSLLTASGLSEVGVQGPPPADPKAAPATAAPQGPPKKAAHTILTYQVRAKGTLAAVVNALENLQRTPVLHRVKGMTLGRQDSSGKESAAAKLLVQLTVEAMIVAGVEADHRPKLEPETSKKLPTDALARDYGDVAKKNIFTGPIPPPPVAPLLDTSLLTAEEEEIPEYVRLVHAEPTTQEAYLRNLIFQMRETRIKSKPGSGYDTFRIMNEDGTKEIMRATVLRIDQRDVYFQVKEDVYSVHIGGTIAQAMKKSLTDTDLEKLELTDLVRPYDPKNDPGKKGTPTKKGAKTTKKTR
jgi:hypothetical protein